MRRGILLEKKHDPPLKDAVLQFIGIIISYFLSYVYIDISSYQFHTKSNQFLEENHPSTTVEQLNMLRVLPDQFILWFIFTAS